MTGCRDADSNDIAWNYRERPTIEKGQFSVVEQECREWGAVFKKNLIASTPKPNHYPSSPNAVIGDPDRQAGHSRQNDRSGTLTRSINTISAALLPPPEHMGHPDGLAKMEERHWIPAFAGMTFLGGPLASKPVPTMRF